jgi:hypothetical protein
MPKRSSDEKNMLRFTIRDVLWLIAVVGLAVGWWLDNRLTASMRVGPPKWHAMLRAIVQDLQERPNLQIEKSRRMTVGVLTEENTWHWHYFNYQESD